MFHRFPASSCCHRRPHELLGDNGPNLWAFPFVYGTGQIIGPERTASAAMVAYYRRAFRRKSFSFSCSDQPDSRSRARCVWQDGPGEAPSPYP